MKKELTIRKRITDLFSTLFKRNRSDSNNMDETYAPPKKAKAEFRSKSRDRWIDSHNQQQIRESKKLRKRRAMNKAARKSRQINYRKVA